MGKAAKISDIEADPEPLPALSLASFSFAFNISSIPRRLAVLPRSRFEASFVARLMSSGRLVALPLANPCVDASKLRRGGRLEPLLFITGSGEAVPLEARAPPFSRWPRIWFTLGSIGDPVGDGSPKYRVLPANWGIGDELRGESRKLASLSYPEYGCCSLPLFRKLCRPIGSVAAPPVANPGRHRSSCFACQSNSRILRSPTSDSSPLSTVSSDVTFGFPLLPFLTRSLLSS